MNFKKALWCGIVIFVILAVSFFVKGFLKYGDDQFGPNFWADLGGGCLGTALSLIVVIISFEIERINRSKSLNAARYLLLRDEGESLKEAYVRYLDTLRLGGECTVKLSGRSWQALKRDCWPDVAIISEVQSCIGTKSLSGTYDFLVIKNAYSELRMYVNAFKDISTIALFEGKEYLVNPVLWEADFTVNSLSAKLFPLESKCDSARQVDLSSIESQIREAGLASGEFLKALCKLADSVNIQK